MRGEVLRGVRRSSVGVNTPRDDVDDAEEPGEERRGVAERDRDDVGREPEVGVEHGLEHLHRVAVERRGGGR